MNKKQKFIVTTIKAVDTFVNDSYDEFIGVYELNSEQKYGAQLYKNFMLLQAKMAINVVKGGEIK